ncbi:MAG: tannase/feruloyl esterase family alpha/beta hydrolase [Lachnospiraceae bacterium]|nr:tannase/feruloyl esterase family alpha/beta hydrolase [Lachnospiraceae bacterium]
MLKNCAKMLKLPLEIPAEQIGLPTRGATVTACKLFHEGEPDPSPFGQAYHLSFTADVYRYEGVIHPVDPEAPDIHFEAGMPLAWNGKIMQLGGGGVNGYVPPCTMPPHGQDRTDHSALKQGYVVFASDSGHTFINGDMMDCSWAINRECFENFAHQSLKKVKDTVAVLTELVYGEKPEKVYFYGGSNGGRECMKAIQNYPEDYDGAICFFPVLYWVQKVLSDIRSNRVAAKIGEAGWIDPETDARIQEAVLGLCDELDGVKDGLISNSSAARQKHEELKAAVRKVVSEEQFQILEAFEEPYVMPYPLEYGQPVFPGYSVFEGTSLLIPLSMQKQAMEIGRSTGSDSVFQSFFAQDPNYELDDDSFDPEKWKDRILELSKWLDAYDTNLDAFIQRGGKLILVQGTTDPQVTMYGTIQYYENLLEKYGQEDLRKFMRFYLAPGYGHGTDGSFIIMSDFLHALDTWVEEGTAPGTLTVTDRNPQTVGRTRPLYEYPGYPVYSGSGDPDDAQNYREGKM